MVFHCSFGDLDEATRVAEAYLADCRRQAHRAGLSEALRHVAAVQFYAGKLDRAVAYSSEAFTIATQYHLPAAAVASATLLTRIHLGLDDVDESGRWYGIANTHLGLAKDAITHGNLATFGSELALRLGNVDAAEGLVAKCVNELAINRSPRVLAVKASLAFMLKRLRDRYIPTDTEVAELCSLYDLLKHVNDADLIAWAVISALDASSRARDARAMAKSYVREFRRDRSPIPHAIRAALVTDRAAE